MYFPYFRSKANELKALRELLEKDLLSKRIIPIIEPVQVSTALYKVIDTFVHFRRKLGIIINPKVGKFQDDLRLLSKDGQEKVWDQIFISDDIFYVYIMNDNSNAEIADLFARGVNPKNLIVINTERLSSIIYMEFFLSNPPAYTLIPHSRALYRTVARDCVMFEDRFIKQSKNSNYSPRKEDFFSDDHLFFIEEGYVGFSDFSIIGDHYIETGFAPFAVVIHITYQDNNGVIYVRHYVSDSNNDRTNRELKIHEALIKMNRDVDQLVQTEGLKSLINLHAENKTTSLGGLKKYSIMHQLELMSLILDK